MPPPGACRCPPHCRQGKEAAVKAAAQAELDARRALASQAIGTKAAQASGGATRCRRAMRGMQAAAGRGGMALGSPAAALHTSCFVSTLETVGRPSTPAALALASFPAVCRRPSGCSAWPRPTVPTRWPSATRQWRRGRRQTRRASRCGRGPPRLALHRCGAAAAGRGAGGAHISVAATHPCPFLSHRTLSGYRRL